MGWALNRRRVLAARGATLLFGVALLAGLFIVGPGCVHVAVAASFEKSDLLGRIATDYNATRPSVDTRCVRIDVFRKASGEAERALAQGWHESDGPYPHAWSPAATTWVTLLERHRAEAGLPNIVPAGLPSIARSPLVIAMPEPMAKALGWPAQNVAWAEIFSLAQDPRGWGRYGHSEWGFRLAKTSPIVSTSGLHTLLATYEAAFQASGTRDLNDERVRASVRGVESSVVHYGDTVSTFLKNLADADDRDEVFDYVSAIVMEEKQIWDYNNGNPEFRLTRTRQVPKIRLVALYPVEGTYLADHPFVVLNESWIGDRERRAAASFVDYLRSNAVQLRFQQDGFRGYGGEPGPIITGNSEFNANLPARIFPSALPAALQQIQSSWPELRKRARVVMIIDSSSSMSARATGSASKLQLAKQAALGALPSFADDDDVALWSFAAAPPRELVPLGPFREQQSTIRREIEQLEAQGSRKALYATITKAVERLSKGFDPARINAVLVLTDGRNDDPERSDLSALIRLLRAQPKSEVVRVFTLGYGSGADLTTLERIAVASHGGGYEATDPRVIDRVFQLIVSNF